MDIKFPKVSGIDKITKTYNNKKENSNERQKKRKAYKKNATSALDKELLFSDDIHEEDKPIKPRLDDYA